MKTIVLRVAKLSRARWFPWFVVGATLLAALLHEVFQPPWIRSFDRNEQAVLWIFMLLAMVLVYLVGSRLLHYFEKEEQLVSQVEQAKNQVEQAYDRLNTILEISQRFLEANDESTIIKHLLDLCIHTIGVTGASFVPIDEHRQPGAAVMQGNLPFPVAHAWVEYLASPAVRERCNTCDKLGDTQSVCPLLSGPFAESAGIYCLPLESSAREFGVLNIYLGEKKDLDERTNLFLRALLDQAALALEGVRLRQHELSALRQMQAVREKTDLEGILDSLVEDVQETLEPDFVLLFVNNDGSEATRVARGDCSPQAKTFLSGVLQGVIGSIEPVLLGDVAGDPATEHGLRSVMAAPLVGSEGESIGALLVANCRPQAFSPRQLSLLQTVTGQIALVIQNAQQITDLEYRTMIQERMRLAREIHDGLAQTLGFLKLQAAQMQNYLDRSEVDRLRNAIELSYTTLSEAYQDVRQAIDGLRISTSEGGLSSWMQQAVMEFIDVSGLQVELEEADPIDLPPEINAQLIRIIQEALNNVRKHARAERAWVSTYIDNEDLWLEVRDDGLGFSPEDVSGVSRHGLRGMRERAELLGADFQVISRPGKGTTVRVRLPLAGVSGKHKNSTI